MQSGISTLDIPCSQSEGQGIKHQVRRTQSVFLSGNLIDVLSDFQLVLGGSGHAFFINGQADYSCIELPGQSKDAVGSGAPTFQMD